MAGTAAARVLRCHRIDLKRLRTPVDRALMGGRMDNDIRRWKFGLRAVLVAVVAILLAFGFASVRYGISLSRVLASKRETMRASFFRLRH
jgi:hypothetical protein